MAKLFFTYGAMNSGKSIEILKVAHNYEEQGKKVQLLTSGLDDREAIGVVASRMGISANALPVFRETDITKLLQDQKDDLDCVLVDEAQFLNRQHVLQLVTIADDWNIPVMAFGLKNDFRNELFEGSQNLLIFADRIEEMKTTCWFCKKKATMNLRYVDGQPVFEGEQIQIGGNETYYSVCRHHYFHPKELN